VRKSRRGVEAEARIRAEIKTLRRLHHTHVISSVGCYITDSKYFNVIFDPLVELRLSDALQKSTESADATIQTKWFGCLAVAIDYIHHMQVRHRHLKPSHILIKNGHVILSGFHISYDYSDAENSESEGPATLTPRYAPPELREQEVRSRSSDIFSLAVFFWRFSPWWQVEGLRNSETI
jgi:serine/threonine protein kinase